MWRQWLAKWHRYCYYCGSGNIYGQIEYLFHWLQVIKRDLHSQTNCLIRSSWLSVLDPFLSSIVTMLSDDLVSLCLLHTLIQCLHCPIFSVNKHLVSKEKILHISLTYGAMKFQCMKPVRSMIARSNGYYLSTRNPSILKQFISIALANFNKC